MEELVSTAWLAAHLNDPDLRIFDTTVHLRPSVPGPYTPEPARADYEAGHIPGAAFIDIANDLSDHNAPTHFTMPSTETLGLELGAAGIAQSSRVVVYSTAANPMWATRLWWMLKSSGFDNVSVLDGGFAKWKSEGRAVETGTRSYPQASLMLSAMAGAWADKGEVLASIGSGAVCTINALSPELHSGEAERNYGRKGHIKGSVNLPYASLLNSDGTFKDDAGLRAAFDKTGVFQKPRVILYCGGGISATIDALALTRLGHPSVAVYDGSMSEWSNDHTLPMEMGS